MTKPTRPAGIVFLTAVFAGLVGLSACSQAQAATLTNADRAARDITIIKGAERHSQRIESGALIQNLCTDGCIVRIDNDPKRDFILEGRERVSIEDGLLYYDGELAPDAKPDKGPAKR